MLANIVGMVCSRLYDHNALPEHLSNYFKRTNRVHKYESRGAAEDNLFYSKVNTLSYGIKSLNFKELRHRTTCKTKNFMKSTKPFSKKS